MNCPNLSLGALWGKAGDIIADILPSTEASAAALLSQLLCGFGNVIGRSPHFIAEADRHGTNLFIVNVGLSSKGRKGSSWGHIERLLKQADPEWTRQRIKSGLSSGEGLLWPLRDEISAQPDVFQSLGAPISSDKRLLAMESEFASVLKVIAREGNILSPILRSAWDGKNLSTLTKNSPINVTDPHISIIGHITKHELISMLNQTEVSNGLGNRFLYFFTERSKLLPEGGYILPNVLDELSKELRASIEFAKNQGLLFRDDKATELWRSVYPVISEGKLGLVGSLSNRTEAQVMRLALIQALINRKSVIDEESLTSALEIHKYCIESLKQIFGEKTGLQLADKICEELEERPNGMSRTEIRDFFGRNQTKESVNQCLDFLESAKLISKKKEVTSGRSAEVWFHKKYLKTYDQNDKSPLQSLMSYYDGGLV